MAGGEAAMVVLEEKDFKACCGSSKFAKEMATAAPFSTLDHALTAARDIWFNKVDVNGWLEAFSAHPQIGQLPSRHHNSSTTAQWSKGEQSTALATATDSGLQQLKEERLLSELDDCLSYHGTCLCLLDTNPHDKYDELSDWNSHYRQKFGFVFLIFASGRTAPEILAELKRRYQNRPIVELENAAVEQMKITELRLAKLFSAKVEAASTTNATTKAQEDRVSMIGAHLTGSSETPVGKSQSVPTRTRPPITTHVLDVARGSPAAGIEVRLEMWKGNQPRPTFGDTEGGSWVFVGSSTTDRDGRSGQLMSVVDNLEAGVYRTSFDTGKYNPGGFFPYVSIVFEVRDSQKQEHFHVPLLLSPFSFTTYRGS